MSEVIDFETADYFTDQALVPDPYPYYAFLRAKGPVTWIAHGVAAVTGYDEAHAVYRDPATFSSINTSTGPFPGVQFTPEGDDISTQLEAHREEFPLFEHMVTFDPPEHNAHRALLMRLFTPKRLKENEDFMWGLADRLLDKFVPAGRCELISQYSQRFTLLVICDLMGVPEEDHELFRRKLTTELHAHGDGAAGGITTEHSGAYQMNPFEFLEEQFTAYIEDRRGHPRQDVLSHFANTPFPDGTLPPIADVVHLSTFVFVAGHETTAKVLGAAVRILAENPELQDRLRAERDLIPNFVEETLRMEGATKSHFRLVKRATTLGGVYLPAGTCVMIANGGVNRDPERFPNPNEFRLDRSNVREHIAFARGAHTCPGAPLARVELRVSLERILDRMRDIRISDAHHGPPGARLFEYNPTYVLRGVEALHIEFTPV